MESNARVMAKRGGKGLIIYEEVLSFYSSKVVDLWGGYCYRSEDMTMNKNKVSEPVELTF